MYDFAKQDAEPKNAMELRLSLIADKERRRMESDEKYLEWMEDKVKVIVKQKTMKK